MKAKQKEYYQRPEVHTRRLEQKRKRDLRPEVKAKLKKYQQRPEVKAKKKEYYQRPEVKDKRKLNRTYEKIN